MRGGSKVWSNAQDLSALKAKRSCPLVGSRVRIPPPTFRFHSMCVPGFEVHPKLSFVGAIRKLIAIPPFSHFVIVCLSKAKHTVFTKFFSKICLQSLPHNFFQKSWEKVLVWYVNFIEYHSSSHHLLLREVAYIHHFTYYQVGFLFWKCLSLRHANMCLLSLCRYDREASEYEKC